MLDCNTVSRLLLASGVGLLLSAPAPAVFAQGQLSTTVGVSSKEAGVFTNTQLNQTNLFQIGSESPSQIWANPAARFTDGITSIVDIPQGATVYQANAVNGYVDNYDLGTQSQTNTAAVAGYFTSRCSASYTICWGINPQVTDRNDLGSLSGVIMYGQETDIDVVNTDTQVNGIAILGNFDAQPKGAWAMRVIAKGTGVWKEGYTTDDGAIDPHGSGLGLGATSANNNSYSQILSLSGIDTSGVHQIATLQATPSGGLNLGTTPGTFFGFYNGPVALNTLAASTSNTACLNGQTYNGLYLISLCSSLRKYKGDIKDLTPSLREVMDLTPVSYVSKTNGNAEIGFVAEDVEKVDKRLSTYASGELVGVQYDHMVALLTKAVQEQQAQIAALQKQVRELKGRK